LARHYGEGHFVFLFARGVERLDSFLLGDLDGGSFEDEDVVTGLEVHRDFRIMFEVARFAGTARGAKVERTFELETPHGNGMGASVGTRRTDPIIARTRQAFFGVAPGQVTLAWLYTVKMGHLRDAHSGRHASDGRLRLCGCWSF
jgi:hypothetical protein